VAGSKRRQGPDVRIRRIGKVCAGARGKSKKRKNLGKYLKSWGGRFAEGSVGVERRRGIAKGGGETPQSNGKRAEMNVSLGAGGGEATLVQKKKKDGKTP